MIWAWQWKRLLVEARRAGRRFQLWRFCLECDLAEARLHRRLTYQELVRVHYRRALRQIRTPDFAPELFRAEEPLGKPLKVPTSLGWDPFFSDVEGRIVDPAVEFLGEPDEDGVELGDVGKAATSKSTSRKTVPPLPPRSSESQVKGRLPRTPRRPRLARKSRKSGEPRKSGKSRVTRKTRKSRVTRKTRKSRKA